jgi:hypothetical protein
VSSLPRFAKIQFVTALVLPLVACLDPCRNTVLSEVTAPGERRRAVVFERDCGATTDFSTHVSVLNATEVLPRSIGNTFIADSDHGTVKDVKVSVRWASSNHLVVSYPTRARIFRQEVRVGDIVVSYEQAGQEGSRR